VELDDLKAILGVFREEAREIAEKMTGELLALETASAAEAKVLLESLFRGAHTLKGGAGSLAIDDVVALAHSVESLLGACQRGERTFVPEYTDALLASLDEVGKRLDAIVAGQTESSGGVASAQMRLARVMAGEAVERVRGAAAGPGETTGAASSLLKVGAERIESFSSAIDELLVTRLRMANRTASMGRLSTALDALSRGAARQFRTEELLELRRISREASAHARELGLETQYLAGLSDDLRESLRGLQVIASSVVLDPFRRSVRDHARKVGVDATLDIVGAEVTADRRILEGLRGPLVHLLRNAVDHAIEPPEERKRAHKPARARVRVEVAVAGSHLTVIVADDGRGMDARHLRAVAVEKEIVTADEADGMSDDAALALVWRSGFSTATQVSETSGRGVGLDAVRESVLALGGRIEVTSRLGVGSTFRIHVPLMLAAALGLAVEAMGTAYVLPLSAVDGVRRLRLADLERVRGVPVLSHAGRAIPVVSLGAALVGKTSHGSEEERPLACIVSDGESACALLVDRIDGEREIAIRPLSPELQRYDHFAGATKGADGRVVLVLSPEGIVRRAVEVSRAPAESGLGEPRTVLVVEDAVTSRLLYRGFLEAGGYEVLLAADGQEALEILAQRRVDAIISDVRMPRLDGLELTRRVRRLEGHETTPLLLVTSLGSEEDRREGLVAGATAYLVKTETPPDKVIDVLGGFLP
jgi:two-component system, chemotaxis family, sensor kinase CheA